MAKKVIFWPFLAFDGRLGGLKDSLEVRVEHETCRTIHGTHLEGIFSQKNSNRMAGWVNGGKDHTEGFPRAGTLGPILAPYRFELKLILVELFRGHISTAF